MESDTVPTIIWLHGSGCQGDSISFLNLFANLDPVGTVDTKDILLNSVNLAYHTVVMSANGETAVNMAMQAKRKGGYVLVLEGAVPTLFNGKTCRIMSINGQDKTYLDAVQEFADNALAVLNVGTCASYGGIPGSGGNPTQVLTVKEALSVDGVYNGPFLMNIPGCPAHPDWIAWAVVQLILFRAGQAGLPELDNYDRPVALFGNKDVDSNTLNVHENCSRNPNRPGGNGYATTYGQDHLCLENLGCRGPVTFADCPSRKWNGTVDENGNNVGTNWCVDSNGMCFGCVEPDFPGGKFYDKSI